jgi:uncharacterized protein (TIGR02266 family)
MTTDRRPEQRRPRVEIILRVEYLHPSDLLHDYVTSISAGEMFIHTSLPLETGERLAFMLSFPGLLEPFDLNGVVKERREPTDDEPGEAAGLVVEFTFADKAQEERLQQLLEALGSPVAQLTPTTFSVLLVEDNAFALELFEYAVTRFHQEHLDGGPELEVKRAEDAVTALEHLDGSRVDLAIVDHFLPGMTGCELVRRMRSDEDLALIPVVVVSVGGDEVKEEAYKSGADLYLDKPVLHRQLISTISKLLRRGAARMESSR